MKSLTLVLIRVATVFLALAALAHAQNLTGSVKNSTTGKPATGDTVVLLKLAQGMEEGARTRTDAKGNFTLPLDDVAAPHLVRITHQGVNYFRPAPPGTTSVELEVYDAAKKVEGISTTVDVMRFQTEQGVLEVLELFAVKNASSPPRTQMNDRNYEFTLPDGAQIDTSLAKAPGGQPINAAPVPQDEKGHYALIFPLRPGETQFQVAYHLPYSGEARIAPQLLHPLEHFVVMLPNSMKFTPTAGTFSPMPDETGTTVQVATGVKPGEPLAFQLSGNGTLNLGEEGGQAPGGEQAANGRVERGRPGGGLGPPTDAPDPLRPYRWYILGGFAAMLVFGAFYVVTRPAGAAARSSVPTAPPAYSPASNAGGTGGRSGLLWEALKEELFQLELDRQQGRISPQEYEKAKAALDHTLQRALSRKP